jgi:NADPH2:quinone reductase
LYFSRSGVVIESKSNSVAVGDIVVCIGGNTLSEEIECDESQVVVLKSKQRPDFGVLASIYVGFMTAYCGLVDRGQMKRGDTVLITGCAGGMGTIALQYAKYLGANVIAAVSSDEKARACRELGAQHVVSYSDLGQFKRDVKALTDGNGVDICYEIVGGDVFQTCLSLIAPLGKLLVIGFASGKIGTIPANLPLVKGYDVRGVRAGASLLLRPELRERVAGAMLDYVASGPPPPLRRYAFADAPHAFQTMAHRRAIGKLVVSIDACDAKL